MYDSCKPVFIGFNVKCIHTLIKKKKKDSKY